MTYATWKAIRERHAWFADLLFDVQQKNWEHRFEREYEQFFTKLNGRFVRHGDRMNRHDDRYLAVVPIIGAKH
jgi:hypothetical protein